MLRNISGMFVALYLMMPPSLMANESQFTFAKLAIESSPAIRGNVTEDKGVVLLFESSGDGISVGGSLLNTPKNTNGIMYVSYTYSFEQMILSVGVNYSNYFDYSQPEIFIELVGREDYYGFSPSIYITRGLSDETTYGEIGMSKDYFVDDWLLNLHTNVSFGQFYTDSFEMNHFDLGIDATTLMTEDVFLSFSVNAFTPLQAIKSLTGESDTEIQLGASILFKF